jgi:hypothetical protein
MKLTQLTEARKKLLEKQEQLTPALTFTIIRDTLQYKSHSGVYWIIEKLIAIGMMEEVDMGDGRKGYRVK